MAMKASICKVATKANTWTKCCECQHLRGTWRTKIVVYDRGIIALGIWEGFLATSIFIEKSPPPHAYLRIFFTLQVLFSYLFLHIISICQFHFLLSRYRFYRERVLGIFIKLWYHTFKHSPQHRLKGTCPIRLARLHLDHNVLQHHGSWIGSRNHTIIIWFVKKRSLQHQSNLQSEHSATT